jgi:hypothetical protein
MENAVHAATVRRKEREILFTIVSIDHSRNELGTINDWSFNDCNHDEDANQYDDDQQQYDEDANQYDDDQQQYDDDQQQYDEDANQFDTYQDEQPTPPQPPPELNSAHLIKYWLQRYQLFSRFDYGIKMDLGMAKHALHMFECANRPAADAVVQYSAPSV